MSGRRTRGIPVLIKLVPEVRILADAALELGGETLGRGANTLVGGQRGIDPDWVAADANKPAVRLTNHERGQKWRSRQIGQHCRGPEKRRAPVKERHLYLVSPEMTIEQHGDHTIRCQNPADVQCRLEHAADLERLDSKCLPHPAPESGDYRTRLRSSNHGERVVAEDSQSDAAELPVSEMASYNN